MPFDGYAEQMKRYGFIPADHEQPRFFDVKKDRLYDHTGKVVPGYCRIARDDTGDTLAVHSDAYRLIPYSAAFEKFDAAIAEAKLDTAGMQIATDLTHSGARCFRQYILPAYNFAVGGDDIALRLISFNSYDGSYAASFQGGFFTFICANTSVHGSHIANLRMKHVGADDGLVQFEDGVKKLIASVEGWLNERGRMVKWGAIEISPAQMVKLVEALPQSTQALCDSLVARYAASDKPKTLWTAYNVLTAWSTHNDSGAKNFAQTKAQREKRVGALIDSEDFRLLEAA